MDSQIGTDIAKLLGNLGKTTDSGGKPASNTEAGAAFKRALVASEQAHSTASSGKTLPAAFATSDQASLPQGPVAATTSAPIFGTHGVVSTELPEFDLHVIGEPVGPRELRKFAEDTGLSAEALAQLFPANEPQSSDRVASAHTLADAIATSVTQWLSKNQTNELIGASSNASAGTSTAVENESLRSFFASELITESARASDQLIQVETADLAESIAPFVTAIVGEATGAPVARGAARELDVLTKQLSAQLKPLIDHWAIETGGAETAAPLTSQVREVVSPVLAQWLDGANGAERSTLSTGVVSPEFMSDRLAQAIAPLVVARSSSAPEMPRTMVAPELLSEIQTVVSRWIDQSPLQNLPADASQWSSDVVGRVTPAVTQWLAESDAPQRVVSQLALKITPEINTLLNSLADRTQSSAPTLASVSAVPAGVSETELSVLKARALSQPGPITLSVAGADVDNMRANPQSLASTLVQVVAPMARPTAEASPVAPAATLDRFALRGVTLRPESRKDAVSVGFESVKGVKAESATALKELVGARSLELARVTPTAEKLAPNFGGQQLLVSGINQGEPAEGSAARTVAQSELSFRQSLATSDRPATSDSARLNPFMLNQNSATREMAGRQLSEALGQRLAANIAAGHYRLSFNVNPRELGAIDVVMEMRDGRLDAQINTGNAVTRELLGDSLPRLREALQQSGINLAHLQVGSDSQQGQTQGRQSDNDQSNGNQAQKDMGLADVATDVVAEDLELGLDLDSVDFWA